MFLSIFSVPDTVLDWACFSACGKGPTEPSGRHDSCSSGKGGSRKSSERGQEPLFSVSKFSELYGLRSFLLLAWEADGCGFPIHPHLLEWGRKNTEGGKLLPVPLSLGLFTIRTSHSHFSLILPHSVNICVHTCKARKALPGLLNRPFSVWREVSWTSRAWQ